MVLRIKPQVRPFCSFWFGDLLHRSVLSSSTSLKLSCNHNKKQRPDKPPKKNSCFILTRYISTIKILWALRLDPHSLNNFLWLVRAEAIYQTRTMTFPVIKRFLRIRLESNSVRSRQSCQGLFRTHNTQDNHIRDKGIAYPALTEMKASEQYELYHSEYCRSDAVNTLNVYLIWGSFK